MPKVFSSLRMKTARAPCAAKTPPSAYAMRVEVCFQSSPRAKLRKMRASFSCPSEPPHSSIDPSAASDGMESLGGRRTNQAAP